MISRGEWHILTLWGTALISTATIIRTQNPLLLGSVFLICMLSAISAIRLAPYFRVEPVMLILWLIALAAMLSVTEGTKAELLAPLYFVCMVVSFVIVRRAHKLAKSE
jgi:hypothetical protein